MMESWEIKGQTLEYDDDTHTYLVDGIIVPSVTQLLHSRFGHKYDNVSEEVLNNAAERGTRIHKAIESWCKFPYPLYDINGTGGPWPPEVKDYQFLMKKYGYKALHNELPVIIHIGGYTYAGRMDLVLQGEKIAVADIKTTATLDKEYLGYQLNLYRLGLAQSYDIVAEELYGIHLKDGKRKMVEIPVKEEEWLVESLIFPGV